MIQRSVSVIIPSFNRCHLLGECLKVLQEQDAWIAEIIVVDDGSSDDTCSMLQTRFPDVHYIYQENQGPSAARNRGRAEASGEFLYFLDSDDLPDPDFFEHLLPAFSDPTVGLVLANFRMVDDRDRVVNPNYFESRSWDLAQSERVIQLDPEALRKRLIKNPVVSPSGVIVRTSVAETWNPSIRVGEDRLFTLETVIQSQCRSLIAPEPLWSYRVHGTNAFHAHARPDLMAYRDNRSLVAITRSIADLSKAEKKTIQRARANNYFDWAYDCRQQGQPRRAHILLMAALRLDPSFRMLKSLTANATTVFGLARRSTTSSRRVLFAANSFDIVGGVETSVLPWIDESIRRGYEIDLVLCRIRGRRADLLESRQLNLSYFPLFRPLRGIDIPNPFGILALASRIRRRRYEAVIGLQPPSHYFLRLAIVLSGQRPRTIAMEQLSYQDRRPYLVWLDRLLSNRTDRFVCVSQNLCSEFLQRTGFPSDKAMGIPHGIQIPRSSVPDSGLAKQAEGRFVIGCVARLTAVKRQRFLIDAVERFSQELPEPPLLILAGDTDDDPQLEKEIRALGKENDVWVLGHRDDIQRIYPLLDLFVLPSVLEGFGLTWAEAMAHGIAVITTNLEPMSDYITHGVDGLLFEKDDIDSLIHALSRFYHDDQLRSSLARNGQEMIREKFDYDRQASRYVDAFLGEQEEAGHAV